MSEAQRFVAHAYKTITGGLPEDLSWIGTADRQQVEQVLQSDYVLHQGRWWDKRGGKGKKLVSSTPAAPRTDVAPIDALDAKGKFFKVMECAAWITAIVTPEYVATLSVDELTDIHNLVDDLPGPTRDRLDVLAKDGTLARHLDEKMGKVES